MSATPSRSPIPPPVPAPSTVGSSFSAIGTDAVPLSSSVSTDAVRARLDELLTRCFYSASGYVFECDPHAVAEDDALIQVFASIREADRRHAHLLGSVIQKRGGVPQPGVFPWWDLDLNFLTVPTLARFVLETLREDVELYDRTLAAWPADDLGSKATLSWIRGDKASQVSELSPVVEAALRRETEATKAAIEVVKKTRAARIAKEKAAAEAAKKAKAAAGAKPAAGAAKPAAAPVAAAAPAALLDPNEPGISKKEKGRRAVMRLRAQHGIATPGAAAAAKTTAAAAPAAATPAGGALLDPEEPGISPKEKAKRQMLKMRAASAPAATPVSVPASAPAAPAVELLDPNEPGISPKEKAKRQMLKMRAASAPAPAPAVVAAAVAAAPALTVEILDPNEPGISPKEKAKRQMLKMRAASAPAAAPVAAPSVAAAPAPVVEDLGDPDEPGLSPKEKARRKVARMRAQSK